MEAIYLFARLLLCCHLLNLASTEVLMESKNDQLVLLVLNPTKRIEGTHRFQRLGSLEDFVIPFKVFGAEEPLNDTDSSSDDHQFHLLKKQLEIYRDQYKQTVVIISQSLDNLVFNAEPNSILEKFQFSKNRILFSTINQAPPSSTLMRDLRAGLLIIGYASDLHQMFQKISHTPKRPFIDLYNQLEEDLGVKLDHHSELLHVYNHSLHDLDIVYETRVPLLRNVRYKTMPAIINGNKEDMDYLSYSMKNYASREWNPIDACLSCRNNIISLEGEKPENYPMVLIGVFIEQATPFLPEFLSKLNELDYPKKMIHLIIRNTIEYHAIAVADYAKDHGLKYFRIQVVDHQNDLPVWKSRNYVIEQCIKHKCDYFFNVDSNVHLDNPYTLQLLIEQNRPVLSPLMILPYSTDSNFFGAISSQRQYVRSIDYNEIITNNRRGLWRVPGVGSCYLIHGEVIRKHFVTKFIYESDDTYDYLSNALRESGVEMMVTNRLDWGHMVKLDTFKTQHLNNELYEIINNRWDWEERYLHPNYTIALNLSSKISMPCPDVFWFPIVTERFADEMVAEMENYGKWAGVGIPFAPRLISMENIGLQQEWIHFLQQYVQPLQQRTFEGYWKPPTANLSFVIRYRPDEMPELKPHHDVSTYTINIALNHAGTDYEGGGCRFLRYNCTLSATRKGWMMMHPGRFSHYHQGLPTTAGTRYILVSFIDP